MKFSLIMSVYLNDELDNFKLAFNSIINQTVPPDEIIITIDGEISEELRAELILLKFQNTNLQIIKNKENKGLGYCRSQAILVSNNDLIAVMDSDDISVSTRFESQIECLLNNSVDVVGGYIEEFDKTIGDLARLRLVQLDHINILKRCKYISPMNHVTLMFRKSCYLESGGYRPIRHIEDYDLIYRMIRSGGIFMNIPSVLVYVRNNSSVLSRRRGIDYWKSEWNLFNKMRMDGFISNIFFFNAIFLRLIVRTIMPSVFLKYLYANLLRKNSC